MKHEDSNTGGNPDYALEANGTLQVVGIQDLGISGTIRVRVNSFEAKINETIEIPGTKQAVTVYFSEEQVASGDEPFSDVRAQEVTIEVVNQRIVTDFTLSRYSSSRQDGVDVDVLLLGLKNTTASLGNGEKDFVTLHGEGEFLILPEGLAAKVEGEVSVAVEDVSVTGNLELEINTTGSPIEENYEISRTSKTMVLPKGPYLQIRGNQVNMEIVEQQLTGNFIFERAADGTKSAAAVPHLSRSISGIPHVVCTPL